MKGADDGGSAGARVEGVDGGVGVEDGVGVDGGERVDEGIEGGGASGGSLPFAAPSQPSRAVAGDCDETPPRAELAAEPVKGSAASAACGARSEGAGRSDV